MSDLVSAAAHCRAPRTPKRDSRRNLVAFFGDMGAFNIGMYFMPTTTILVGLASLLTDDKALIGIVGLAWKASWYLPQLLAARLLHGRPRKAFSVLAGSDRPADDSAVGALADLHPGQRAIAHRLAHHWRRRDLQRQ